MNVVDGSSGSETMSSPGRPARTSFLFSIVCVMSTAGVEIVTAIMLPLWIDYAKGPVQKVSSTMDVPRSPNFDAYAVLFCASLVELIVFVALWLMFGKYTKNERSVSKKSLIWVGMTNGLHFVLTPFVSSGSRTPPYLQALLFNSYVPLTVLFRFFMLGKVPTRRKMVSVTVVMLALFVCLIPSIWPAEVKADLITVVGGSVLLWCFYYIITLVPSVVSHILEEDCFHNTNDLDIYYMNVWSSICQLVLAVGCFWIDIIPGIGEAESVTEVIQNVVYGLQIFFFGNRGSFLSTLLGLLYIISVCLQFVIDSILLKYTEGATFWALASNLVTPISYLFWQLFDEYPLAWNPRMNTDTFYSLVAIAMMIWAINHYNSGPEEKTIILSYLPRMFMHKIKAVLTPLRTFFKTSSLP